MQFEWDPAKAKFNEQAHGVAFDLAKTAFKDVFAVERLDDRRDYGEARYVLTGMAEGKLLLVVIFTERENRIRIISARRATRREKEDYLQQNSESAAPDDG